MATRSDHSTCLHDDHPAVEFLCVVQDVVRRRLDAMDARRQRRSDLTWFLVGLEQDITTVLEQIGLAPEVR
jgi:hypothetical protein